MSRLRSLNEFRFGSAERKAPTDQEQFVLVDFCFVLIVCVSLSAEIKAQIRPGGE